MQIHTTHTIHTPHTCTHTHYTVHTHTTQYTHTHYTVHTHTTHTHSHAGSLWHTCAHYTHTHMHTTHMQDLFGSFLPHLWPSIIQGLKDVDDDVRSVAVTALVPVADQLHVIMASEVCSSTPTPPHTHFGYILP